VDIVKTAGRIPVKLSIIVRVNIAAGRIVEFCRMLSMEIQIPFSLRKYGHKTRSVKPNPVFSIMYITTDIEPP
jgi:hypothetical protein